MNARILVLPLGLALLQAGCMLSPDYVRPEAPVPAAWPEGPAYGSLPAAGGAPAVTTLNWRSFFTDEKLVQIIGAALTNNRDLRVAALTVERARALYGIQRAEAWPTVNANVFGSKQRMPGDISMTGNPRTTKEYDVNLGIAAWEIDFFGRVRNLSQGALERFFATEQARRSAQILLVSSVAGEYLNLAADREKLRLAQTTLEAQQQSYNLIKRSFELGLIPETDAWRAQSQVDSARREVARFTQQVAQDRNALNFLAGSPVAGDLLPAALEGLRPQAEAVPGVASAVLLQRPDVMQAENTLKAAHADVNAARATLFPRITLTTSYGTASRELSGLFEAGSEAWIFAPRLAAPIFDRRSRLALAATKVQREIAVAQYEKAIQTAFREVADALAVRGSVDAQLAAQESLVKAVDQTYRLSRVRYEKGLDSYLGVLDAQQSLYVQQQILLTYRQARAANQVRLYAVLGGGGDP